MQPPGVLFTALMCGFGIVERPLDALQLLALDIERGIWEIQQLPGVIQMGVADDDLLDVGGVKTEQLELVGQRDEMLECKSLVVLFLFPARYRTG